MAPIAFTYYWLSLIYLSPVKNGAIQMLIFYIPDAGQSKCRLERTQALEQAKKPQEAVFIPECNEDGSFTQVSKEK